MKKNIVLLLALFISIGVSAQFSPGPQSKIVTDSIHSEILKAAVLITSSCQEL